MANGAREAEPPIRVNPFTDQHQRRRAVAKLLALATCVLLTVGPGFADSAASASASWRDKTIDVKITGADSASASSSSVDKQCTVRIKIDGKRYTLLVTQTGLVFQGKPIVLTGFKKIEVTGNQDVIRIVVDGKQVHP